MLGVLFRKTLHTATQRGWHVTNPGDKLDFSLVMLSFAFSISGGGFVRLGGIYLREANGKGAVANGGGHIS